MSTTDRSTRWGMNHAAISDEEAEAVKRHDDLWDYEKEEELRKEDEQVALLKERADELTKANKIVEARRVQAELNELLERRSGRTAEIAANLKQYGDDVIGAMSKRLSGKGAMEASRAVLQAILFGHNTMVQGTSGIGKTTLICYLLDLTQIPYARYDCTTDTADMHLIGGETVADGKFYVRRGAVMSVGKMYTVLDEINRLASTVASSLLQCSAERQIRMTLLSKGGTHTITLSPAFAIFGAFNPLTYTGVSNNEALLDRAVVGFDQPHPTCEERVAMLSGSGGRNNVLTGFTQEFIPCPFKLSELRWALGQVRFSPEHLRHIVAASYLASPPSFRKEYGWDAWEYLNKSPYSPGKMREIETQTQLHVLEGSNPRGEEYALQAAAGACLMAGRATATAQDVAKGVRWAFRFRLKPQFGSDSHVRHIIDRVAEVVLGVPANLRG